MDKPKIIAWGMVVASLVGCLATLLITPPPLQADSPAGFHFNFYLSVSCALLQFAATALFLWGLRDFKTQLRVAFGIICAGVALLGIAQLQSPILNLFDLWDSIWVRGGLVIIPDPGPIILLFVGVRRFAHLLEIKTRWTSLWLTLVLATVVGAGVAFLPHAPIVGSEIQFRASMGVGMWSVVVLVMTTALTIRLRQLAGPVYKEALFWFTLGVGAQAFAGLNYMVINLVFGDNSPLIDHGGTSLPFTIGALLFVRAGYAFLAINQEAHAARRAASAPPVSLLDIVFCAAGEASNPVLIDEIMEPVRSITATMQPGQPLGPDEEQTLHRVYHELEHYLAQDEPVRKFTIDQVRQTVASKMGVDPTSALFSR